MKRITIVVPDDLARAVAREAKRRDTSTSEVFRVAVTAHLGIGKPRQLPFANLGSSDDSGAARRMEEILAEEWEHDLRR